MNLIDASKDGCLEDVKKLILEKADVHAENDWALRTAAWNGHVDVVQYLLTREETHEKDIALQCAIENHHLPVVECLLKAGANIRDGALHFAAFEGDVKMVTFLVEAGADIRANDHGALRSAALGSHFQVIEYLLNRGSKFNPKWWGIPPNVREFFCNYQIKPTY